MVVSDIITIFVGILLTIIYLLMNELVSIILIVFGILQIILFFKIWGMTNDTDQIKRMLNLRNRLSFFHKLPPKCKDTKGNVYFVRGFHEDIILCSRNKNDENLIGLKITEIGFIED